MPIQIKKRTWGYLFGPLEAARSAFTDATGLSHNWADETEGTDAGTTVEDPSHTESPADMDWD
jgi:hypothetical protein